MNLSIAAKIKVGFAMAVAMVLITGIAYFRNADQIKDNATAVTHTFEVIQQLHNLVNGLAETESAERALMITGDAPFREAVRTAETKINRTLPVLKTLTADNPAQQQRIGALEPVISRRLQLLHTKVQLLQASQGKVTPQIMDLFHEGARVMAEVRQLIAEAEREEQTLLAERQQRATKRVDSTSGSVLLSTLSSCLVLGTVGFLVKRSVSKPLQRLGESAAKLGAGDYSHRAVIGKEDEVGQLAAVFNKMGEQIQKRQLLQQEQDWLKTSLARLTRVFEGERNLSVLCQSILTELATLVDARHSVFYLRDPLSEEIQLKLQGSYAVNHPKPIVKPGEGLVGQCFLDQKRILINSVPDNYLKINSALGNAKPNALVVLPVLFGQRAIAVIELASFQPLTEIQLTFLDQLAESIGIVVTAIEANVRTEELLRETKIQAQELRAGQQELSDKNHELAAQSERLQKSEQLLEEQQEELKQANEELRSANEELEQTSDEMAEKARLLEIQKKEGERKNEEIEQARAALEEKAKQLGLISKYKSEFLANMSHELRTPLNSLLILSKILTENADNNLTSKQVRYAQTIHSSGNDLLELINDILDLSKIESGNAEKEIGALPLADLADFVEQTFRHIADNKQLDFRVHMDPNLPATISTDGRRLQQVIKNLLSNAFKFTDHGSVELKVSLVANGWDPMCKTLNEANGVVAFAAIDTGLGIPKEKQQLIFEAFQQADAGTARKYGGTGLGLSISREIAKLLGGALSVESEPGRGSKFTLFLPTEFPGSLASETSDKKVSNGAPTRPLPSPLREVIPTVENEILATEDATVEDDSKNLKADDMVLLVVEDDRNFAQVLVEFARENKFKAVVAGTAERAISLAQQIKPSAITLDILLPDNDGWVVLDRLKHDPRTRHIPVHVISVEDRQERSLKLGAISCLRKPVTKEALDDVLGQTIAFIRRPVKNLLIVEDDDVQRQSMVDLIQDGDVNVTAVATGTETLEALSKTQFDCLVVDLRLPDMPGLELIQEIQRRHGRRSPPVVVYTGKELSRQEETALRQVSESIIIKDIRSPERLLDETALFLHRVQAKLPESKRRIIEQIQKEDSVLSGRTVLVVDDDVRNIFAITSALESHKMRVLYAESGKEGIETLQANPEIELVLMDVMMPEMDGFETTRRIRQDERFKKLPIISVTAKAMKGDREKCLQAGASDYITKPVDMDQLRSLLRVWLYR